MAKRSDMLDQLEGQFDVLIIGGGVTGSGIARDAAQRGLSVALVEMGDLASGTSSCSSKLVHGGLRYLEHYEFSLVFEAVSERRILMDIAPHLVNPLGFLFPVYEGSRRKLWLVNAGMWLYDGLSLFRSPKLHKKLSAAEVAEIEPAVERTGLSGAPLYYDCSTDDARLTLETALDAVQSGATIATWCRAKSFLKSPEGRVLGAVVEDVHTGALREVKASVVINATGPWTDRTVAMSKPLATGGLLRPTKGVHIVVDAEKLPVNHAVVCFHPVDGRVLFAVPWGDRTYIGTTDTDFEGDPSDVCADADDVRYLIDACAAYFPDHQLTTDDVISTWAGLRPLMAPVSKSGDIDESAVSREHQIVVGQDGLITIAGGKLTTYRLMSAEVVETAVKLLRLSNASPELIRSSHTDREPLPGAIGWPEDDDHERVAALVAEAGGEALGADTAKYLADTYGMRGLQIASLVMEDAALGERLVAGRPEILAQVDWAVHRELAVTVTDVLRRRTQLYYRDHDQGLGCAPTVAARMGQLLDWDKTTEKARLDAYGDEVAMSRRWRHQEPSSPNNGKNGNP
ncbi:MAG: glycerol-3-phosphate dehydrogenase [Proteobacteria bacterium]|nr:glycerol-3-phosphate dehydrogenase [Pseudomonadota bacterium]